ncbi:DUF2306 domain-containing protein [Micromonospora echinofusca]|uniref:DUF2306 domain-containing protein n=1 Tax=Micromonospora echinofusca TaxID=47858 RepID=A0ABS3VRV9_MICEH|nr:DUF2306 domain-containing protein [Micromonospora echinofusca]MBO4207208.1 DUF2306 domain-containing protein [Micromonospora echinofusca]
MTEATITRPAGPATIGHPPRPSRAGWLVVALSALAVGGYSLALYAQGSLADLAGNDTGLAVHYASAATPVQIAFYLHVATGSLALLLGPAQFSRRLRQRYPTAHRLVGRTYLGAVALGVLSALVLAPVNSAGLVGLFGFGGLAVLWGATALRGYHAVRGGDLRQHRAWMIRNYALTYAAVTLRTWLGVLIAVQLPFAGGDFQAVFDNAYAPLPFLAWLPNLVVAEWLIRRRGLPSYRLTA